MAIMYALGYFFFSSDTIVPAAVDRSNGYNWQSMPRNGRRPARQPVGLGEETLTMNGVFYPCEQQGPTAWTLEALRYQAEQMEPLTLISMSGLLDGWAYVHGRWTVDNITENRSMLWPNASPRKVAFLLNLSRYGEDLD